MTGIHHHLLLLFFLAILLAISSVSGRQIDRQLLVSPRQSTGQDEERSTGNCTQMSNKCNIPSRNTQCPFDGAPCVLIEPKGDSSRRPEVRCNYLGST
ncbi:hypothetical protein CCHL11_10272 [Colletotrichum chlorophyti]|uniref:Uncharacterized protein n=1 Tax=Colletotrichum chlorophyti TaxID=708187 RepID=A0A1Q8RQB6_9PEZI|nr:hypothetical protein CCHL11_10272 [Colletotrichum chlorophyti]